VLPEQGEPSSQLFGQPLTVQEKQGADIVTEADLAALVSLDSEREDQLAGTCIAQEAGALVTDLTGSPSTSAMTRLLAAGHPALHTALLPFLSDVIS
jgi:fructose-1,6-bisphosphatase/inositol monophosphatase family enzyme